MDDGGDVGEVGQEGGDDGDDDQAGEDHAEGGDDAAQDALFHVAHKGGRVDGDDAGGALADGVVVGQFGLGGPFLFLHHFSLEQGEHGQTATEGADANFGEGGK